MFFFINLSRYFFSSSSRTLSTFFVFGNNDSIIPYITDMVSRKSFYKSCLTFKGGSCSIRVRHKPQNGRYIGYPLILHLTQNRAYGFIVGLFFATTIKPRCIDVETLVSDIIKRNFIGLGFSRMTNFCICAKNSCSKTFPEARLSDCKNALSLWWLNDIISYWCIVVNSLNKASI